MAYLYSAEALIAGHTAFRTLLDTGPADASISIYTAADSLLVSFDFTDPCGTIDAAGQFTLTPALATVTPSNTGTASYAEIYDADGNTHLTIDCIAGAQAVSGYCVLNDLSIVSGQDVTLVGMVIG